jgi:hypothetical protein
VNMESAESAKDSVDKIEEVKKRKEIALRSEVWSHFINSIVDSHLKKRKCKYRSCEIKCDPNVNGTSALCSHFNICKCNPHENRDSNQSNLQLSQGDNVVIYKFDPDAIRKAFTEMVIVDEQAFTFAERQGFRKFMSVACPCWNVTSRRTLTRDIVGRYFEEKAKLKTFIKQQCERVCIITNAWTSQLQDSYMVVTSHFIDSEWKLHKKLIGFAMVKGHKGDDIGKTIMRCLAKWG